jgi:hypothetical protein
LRDSWSYRTFVAKNLGAWVTVKKFGENKGSVKNFYGVNLSIYKGEGGSFKNPPWFDRCEFSRGRVSTPTLRGWRFLPRIKYFRGNGSSESTRFPEGLVLGNLVKPCHPRNVGLLKFTKQVRETTVGERYRLMKKEEEGSSVEFQMFRRFVVLNIK